jgi:hypothetical protein
MVKPKVLLNSQPTILMYATRFLNDHVDEFLRQLVITMGKTNWRVTWIGHGELTKDKVLSYFMKEDKYHEKYIMKKYNDWYDQAVIEASNRYMNKPMNRIA